MRGGKNQAAKQQILIRRVFKEKFIAPFILGAPKTPGLYRRVGKKLEMLQLFRKDAKKVKRNDWLRNATKRAVKKTNLEREWYKACRFAWSKLRPR